MASFETEEPWGISLPTLTQAALLATVFCRGIAPAIPGVAVGIERFIVMSAQVSAFLSHLVAAGGVTAAIVLAIGALRQPKLDLTYRLLALPGGAIVVALVLAAWVRPLEPELCRMVAFAAIAAAIAGAVASLRVGETRASGLGLACASTSGLTHLLARELVSRAAERMDSTSLHWAVAVATLAALFDLMTLGVTLIYLGQGKARKIATSAAWVLLPALLLGLFAAHGSAPGVGAARVLAERALTLLSRVPAAMLPAAFRFALTAALLIAAGLCVFRPGARSKTSVVLALALLSLGAPDMPLPALWLVVAALLSPKLASMSLHDEPTTPEPSPPPTI
ncbi:MAG: hypothetical protein ABIQ16_09215 [Polyangiaceae bacterium]